ncbi:MAG: 2-amino-4-hydroxy-6-hydroxymethyldihydropteridine diphosphokinase [bacterium]|nr:MAG: 2-amino-4-hydroxy-6-hydroxymethyldihydropteridine diphosphokinase [bacterium]
MMPKVFISLGSNKGDRQSFLIKAVTKMKQLGNFLSVSPLYRSSAYGFTDQPDFYNAVIIMDTEIPPQSLLKDLKEIELAVGRIETFHWGPREIDLDIILYEQMQLHNSELSIPHPDFQNRIFVLKPLADIAPEYPVPGENVTISELLNKCQDETIIEIVKKDWYSNGVTI